jgi:hypothetical protein
MPALRTNGIGLVHFSFLFSSTRPGQGRAGRNGFDGGMPSEGGCTFHWLRLQRTPSRSNTLTGDDGAGVRHQK